MRSVIVDGVEWEYCVRGFIGIYLKNLITNEAYRWWQDVKPKWGYSFKPSDVANLIRSGEANGIAWKQVS